VIVGEKIRKLLAEWKINQTELSHLLEVDQSTITKYMKGEREPERYLRLVIAGMTQDKEDRDWWIKYAEVTPKEEEALRIALAQSPQKPESTLVAAIEREISNWKSGRSSTGEQLVPNWGENRFTFIPKSDYNRGTPESEKKFLDRVAKVLRAGNPVVINNLARVLDSGEVLLRAGGTHDRKDAERSRSKKSASRSGGDKGKLHPL